MKRYVVMLAVMALLMVALAMPAFAAPQGQTERGAEHANSVCSFSGLNDFEEGPGPQVQSYGQIVSSGGKAFAPSPGTLCNAHLFPYPEHPIFQEEE